MAKRFDDFSDDEEEIIKKQFKVILLGDGTVGKSSIALRFSADQFTKNYKQTVGCDFLTKQIDIPPRHQVILQIWDIGGQSINSKMISKYITGSHAVMLCYDITNYDSFANLEDWYRIVVSSLSNDNPKQFKESPPYIALVGNKNDLRHMQQVTIEKHNKFADENQMRSFLMSAKNGDQVLQTFYRIAYSLADIPPDPNDKSKSSTRVPAHIATHVVPAQIVDHQRHDEEVAGGKVPEYTKQSICSIS